MDPRRHGHACLPPPCLFRISNILGPGLCTDPHGFRGGLAHPLCPIPRIITNGVSLLQTKLGNREGYETVHVGL
jgi:hypothetical protein